MKIAALNWRGVAGLPDGQTALSSAGGNTAGLVALTGTSGSGKSRLLFAIVHAKERLAPYGPGFPDNVLTGGGDRVAKMSITWSVSDEERDAVGMPGNEATTEVLFPRGKGLPPMNDPSLIELLERYSHSKSTGKIDYIPPDRVLPKASASAGDVLAEQKRKRLTLGSDKFASLKRAAVEAIRQNSPQASELRWLFSELCPNRKLGDVTARADLELRGAGEPTPLAHASSSEWEAFIMAATITILGLHHSVVLYDTPELHLDDAEAKRRLTVLCTAAPTTQFIVATKSSAVIEAADSVVRLGETS